MKVDPVTRSQRVQKYIARVCVLISREVDLDVCIVVSLVKAWVRSDAAELQMLALCHGKNTTAAALLAWERISKGRVKATKGVDHGKAAERGSEKKKLSSIRP